MKHIGEYTLREVSTNMKKMAVYGGVAAVFAIAAVALAATWNDSLTGGTGQLTEAEYNALVAHLSNAGPATWTCNNFDGVTASNSIANCGAGYTLISGGCALTGNTGTITASNPGTGATQGWSCWGNGATVTARAWCCK